MRIELLLLKEAIPNWSIHINQKKFQRFILQFGYKKAVNQFFGCEMGKLSGFEIH